MRPCGALLVVAFVLAACGGGEDQPEPGWSRLPNGLRFAVKPMPDAKSVAVLLTLSIGSDHDPEGRCGLAHLAEHLFVTSAAGTTASRTAEQWAAVDGIRRSASTWPRFTDDSAVITPDRLGAELDELAARMADLRIEAADLARERPRVLQQIAEEEDRDPAAACPRVAFMRLSPPPHGVSGVGVARDVEAITLDEVRERCRRFYQPVNARLVLAGAVDPTAAAELVASRFGGLASGELAPDPEPAGRPLPGTVEIETGAIPAGAETCKEGCVAYSLPPPSDRDHAAALVFLWRAVSLTHERPHLMAAPSLAGDAVALRWVGDEPSVADLTRLADEMVARFQASAPTPDETRRLVEMMRARPGMDSSTDMPEYPEITAARIALAAMVPVDVDRVCTSLANLTQSDLQRFADRWLHPSRRVVVIVRGVRKPAAPLGATDAYLDALLEKLSRGAKRDGPSAAAAELHEVRVVLRWDEATSSPRWSVAGREIAEDAELEKAIIDAYRARNTKGKTDAYVTIDADVRVPWNEVVNVMNVVKRCGIDKIEFSMGAPSRESTPK